MRKARRYIVSFGLAAVLSAVLIAAFNIFMDPYGVWNGRSITGINRYHSHKESFERMNKSFDVVQMQPNILLVGSSRVKFGLNPDYYTFLTGDSSVYNFGVNGPNIYVIRRLVENAVRYDDNLAVVYLGLDFMMFNERNVDQPGFDEEQLLKRHLSIDNFMKTSFSSSAVRTAAESLALNYREARDYDVRKPNGMGTDEQALVYHKWGIADDKMSFVRSAKEFSNKDIYYKDFVFSADYFANVAAIVALCREHGIKLEVFIPPIHAVLMEQIDVLGIWDEYETWKRELAKLVDYKDFSGYNYITSEPYDGDSEFFWDTSHFRSTVGDLMFDYLLNDIGREDFGRTVNRDNIEQHLAEIRQQRIKWRSQNAFWHDFAVYLAGFSSHEPVFIRSYSVPVFQPTIVIESVMGKRTESFIELSEKRRFYLSGWVASDRIYSDCIIAVLQSRSDGSSYYTVCDDKLRSDAAGALNMDKPVQGFVLDAATDQLPAGEYALAVWIVDRDNSLIYKSDNDITICFK